MLTFTGISINCWRGTVDGIEQVVVGDGGADTVEYNLRSVDLVLQIHYPAATMDASDVETGYLMMRVDGGAEKVTGVPKNLGKKKGEVV